MMDQLTTGQLTYLELATELKHERHFKTHSENYEMELLFTCESVKFFRVRTDGVVTGTNYGYKLQIVRISCRNYTHQESCYVQVIACIPSDDSTCIEVVVWVYPLIPGVSPCLAYENKALIFPEMKEGDNSSIGIIIHNALSYAAITQILFDSHHNSSDDTIDSIPEHILKVAFIVSKNCIINAKRTNNLIEEGTTAFINTIPKIPTELQLPERLKVGIAIAKTSSEIATATTGFLATQIATIKMDLSHFLAHHIEKNAARHIPKNTGKLDNKSFEEILSICVSLNEAHATIKSGLQEAAVILKRSLNENSLVIVDHIYGAATAKAVRDLLETMENGKRTKANMESVTLSPSKIIMQVLKSTAKQVIYDVVGKKRALSTGSDATDSGEPERKVRKTEENKSLELFATT